MSTADLPTSQRVRKQYEQLPYPHRNPDDEKKRLLVTLLDNLGAVNFYCWGGRRDFTKNFRALVAGGGTGDSVVYLANQLKNTDAKIVYVDLSTASMDIARKRAAAWGLADRIVWKQGSLLDLPKMGFKPFDFINCCGVLHHLEEPKDGIAALRSVLKDDGALGLMLYGKYGRTGVYQMQELMRVMNEGVTNDGERLEHAKLALGTLPHTNWFARGCKLFWGPGIPNDSEVYDIFLHSQDRAYTVSEVDDLLESAGLRFAEHTLDQRPLYNPDHAFQNPVLRAQVAKLPYRKQQAAAELWFGAITKHTFWATAGAPEQPRFDDPDNIPFFGEFARLHKIQDSIVNNQAENWTLRVAQHDGIQLAITFQNHPDARRFVELIDNRRTLGSIVETIVAESETPVREEDVRKMCGKLVQILLPYDLILLRHKSTPAALGAATSH